MGFMYQSLLNECQYIRTNTLQVTPPPTPGAPPPPPQAFKIALLCTPGHIQHTPHPRVFDKIMLWLTQ